MYAYVIGPVEEGGEYVPPPVAVQPLSSGLWTPSLALHCSEHLVFSYLACELAWTTCEDCHCWFGTWQVESLRQGRGPERRCSWNALGHVSLAVRPEGVQPDMSVPVCGKVRIIHSTFWVSFFAFGSLRVAALPSEMASIPAFLGRPG